jgi:hypothetical protein
MSAKLRLNKEVVLVAMGVKADYYLQNFGWVTPSSGRNICIFRSFHETNPVICIDMY